MQSTVTYNSEKVCPLSDVIFLCIANLQDWFLTSQLVTQFLQLSKHSMVSKLIIQYLRYLAEDIQIENVKKIIKSVEKK